MDPERKAKEAQEEQEKARKASEKKEKDEQKKLLKNERKKLRIIAKDNNYFCSNDDEKVSNLAEVEKMCEIYTIEQLKDLVKRLEGSLDDKKTVFSKEMDRLNNRMEEERSEQAQMTNKSTETGKSKAGVEWDTDELQLLIKSINLFPAGTVNRFVSFILFLFQYFFL